MFALVTIYRDRELLRRTASRICRYVNDEYTAIARAVLRSYGDDARSAAINSHQRQANV